MLAALINQERILKEFYLDNDDITIRRKKDGYHGRFKKDDIVKGFKYTGNSNMNYVGIHIPRTRNTVSLPWVLTVLRKIPFIDGQVIDHKDGDVSNNLRNNLEITSQKMNNRNRCINKNNTSGYAGIHYMENAKLYIARIRTDGKRLYRSSKTLEEAVEAMKELKAKAKSFGYTDRHGTRRVTTIPKGSTP